MTRKLTCLLTALCATFGLSLYASADTTPEDAADYRTAIMTSLRGHLVASSMIARGLIENRGQLVDHARGIAAGATEMTHLFPVGSNIADSEALPVIWEDEEGFAAAIEDAKAATAAFVEAAESGDRAAIGAAFREVGGSCRGCHDKYRVAQD